MIDDQLRSLRPIPPTDLVDGILAAVPHAPRSRGAAVLLTGLTAIVLAALLGVGGVSYAATAVANAVRTVVVTHTTQTPLKLNAGGDQYRPGYGFGDPNHNHTGPPGLRRAAAGEKAPTPQTQPARDGKAVYVSATLGVDEQAALYFSVLDAHGDQLLLTQSGTVIGTPVDGPQTKTIHYVMLVPRTVTFRIRIPANLVTAGATYTVRVIAVDAQGNKSLATIPFTV
ncbi:MAG TPA: hypothetical protein VI408_12885 [Gaiellaceae bacterium]